jgi:hypothetical protein
MRHGTLALLLLGLSGCSAELVLYRPSDAVVDDGGPPDLGRDWGSSVKAIVVKPLYPAAGAGWMDYVANDGPDVFRATDVACDAKSVTSRLACLHGGEMRAAVLEGAASCAGITARDDLGLLRWRCVQRGGQAVTVASTALAAGKGLRDALEPGRLRENALTVLRDGEPAYRSAPATWWENPVLSTSGGEALTQSGAIYQVSATGDTAGIAITADGAALVTMPGVVLRHKAQNPNCESGASRCALVLEKRRLCWIEVALEAGSADFGIHDTAGALNTINASTVDGATTGILAGSPYGRLRESSAARFGTLGISVEGTRTLLLGVSAAQGSNVCCHAAIGMRGEGAIAHRVKVFSTFHGLALGKNNQTLTAVLAASNNWGGESTKAGRMTLSHFTFRNRDKALALWSHHTWDRNTAAQWLSVGHTDMGLDLSSADENLLANIASANNKASVQVSGTGANNRFTGLLLVGAAGKRCTVSSTGAAPGLIDGTCTDSGADGSSSYAGQTSDAILRVDRDLGASLVGAVTVDDAANASDSAGAAGFDAIQDWSRFESFWRVWGQGTSLCRPGVTCRIEDCRLRASDDQVRERTGDGKTANAPFEAGKPCPPAADGDRAIEDQGNLPHAPHDNALGPGGGPCAAGETCHNRFLLNALELMEDGVGDEDGLCESDEACVYSPNFGAYQGEGPLVGPCVFKDGAVSGVTLYAHSKNGV